MELVINFPEGARVDAALGNMVIKTDQPPSGGGNGSAPTPFALFLASMGTCAGIYVLSFCKQRGLPTDEISIVQSMEMDPVTHMVKTVNLDIKVPVDFPQRYKSALIRSAQLCAVKKHLEKPPTFNIQTITI
jgi:ribosomal protein S12 methylthiotransferase accessory factor